MSEIQAKRGYLKVERILKNGQKKSVRDEVIVSAGMMDGHTVERELMKAADTATARGEKVLDGVVEVFDKDEVAPAAWAPLMNRHSQLSFAGFDSPMNHWQPDSPMVMKLKARRECEG
jgi:hypothetical protein